MFFRQIKKMGDNFSYIIADEKTGEAAVVDPSFNVEEITCILKERNLRLKFVIDTHGHTDHTAGNAQLKSVFGAKVVAHKVSKVDKDVSVTDGDRIELGSLVIRVIHTPGHTPDGICLLVDNKLLTGDTLFVGECGRTDLPGGSPEQLYHSLFDKLVKLDDAVEVYPGHDYGPEPHSTIGEQKRTNYVLEERSLKEFVRFMGQP